MKNTHGGLSRPRVESTAHNICFFSWVTLSFSIKHTLTHVKLRTHLTISILTFIGPILTDSKSGSCCGLSVTQGSLFQVCNNISMANTYTFYTWRYIRGGFRGHEERTLGATHVWFMHVSLISLLCLTRPPSIHILFKILDLHLKIN